MRSYRRRLVRLGAALLLALARVSASAFAESSAPVPSCSAPGDGWCIARRIPGTDPKGELGFRFGEPLDADGDGHPDIAAGARFKLQQKTLQAGSASVWSGASGSLIRSWDGEPADGLFGHWVMLVPDISGDGLADVVITAPHQPVADGRMRGVVVARSPKTGAELWRRAEVESENLGWDVADAGDQNGDGTIDLFVGAPSENDGRVYLLSGKDGTVLHTYAKNAGSFGWTVARLDDLDGDGHPELAVGAPFARNAEGTIVGGAWILSSATGKELRHWQGTDPLGGFANIVASVADLDGDGKSDLAVAVPATDDHTRRMPGELRIYSTKSGKELRHWSGSQPGEQYSRMVIDAGDLDGDGTSDLAIGAPWYRRGTDDRVGRVELRSARTGAVLGELFGDEFDSWFGWHMSRAPDPEGRGRPALLISSLRHPLGGSYGVGVLDLLVLRPKSRAGDQGTITRGARRSDIK